MSKKELTVSLEKYLKAKIKASKREAKIRHKATALALSVNKEVIEARLVNLNELRKEVVDDRVKLVGKDIYYAHIDAERKSTDDILKRLTIMETRSVTWSAALVVFFIIVQIVLRIFHI
jgi:hypothetical protein